MKSKTKKILLRLFNLIMICFVLLNIMTAFGVIGGESHATDVWRDITSNTSAVNPALSLEIFLTGLTYIFTFIIKVVIIGIGAILQLIMTGVYNGFETSNTVSVVTAEDIIFSGVGSHSQFLSVDFLDGNSSGLAGTFRDSVAQWYYTLRLVSAGGLLVILIYVGLKMALSTLGKSQAKYKEMFMDWVSSVALLFMLHWIIAFVIMVNNAMMTGLNTGLGTVNSATAKMLTNLMDVFWDAGFHSILAAVVYTILVGQIFKFFILYIKRMLTVGFLIMISPLITITYALDKMGDGKAQALGAWLKELSYNILIQPFHAVIFLSFYSTIGNMVDSSMAPYIFIVVLLNFMSKAEDIIRHIFHFQANSMSTMSAAAQTLGNAQGTFVKLGSATAKGFTNFRKAGGLKAAAPWAYKDLKLGNLKFGKNKNKAQTSSSNTPNSPNSPDGSPNTGNPSGTKPTTAQKMKAKVDAMRKKRETRRENNAVEKRAKENYDKVHGEGSFDKRVKFATGNTWEAEQAAEELEGYRTNARKELTDEKADKANKKSINKEIKKNPKEYKGMSVADARAKAENNLKEKEALPKYAPQTEEEKDLKKFVDKKYKKKYGKNAYEKLKYRADKNNKRYITYSSEKC